MRPTMRRATLERWVGSLAPLLAVATAIVVASSNTGRALTTDPWQATANAETWWREKIPANVRDSSTCCLPRLEAMRAAENEARSQYERSQDPTLSDEEHQRAVDAMNAALVDRERNRKAFRSCVFGIWYALAAEQDGIDPAPEVARSCGGPVAFIANLGWRRCVDLASSPYRVDSWMASLQTLGYPAYNCHYYTKSYLATLFPDVSWSPSSILSQADCLRSADRHGFTRVPRRSIRVGDIVLVKQPGPIPGCAWAHSGIVTEVDATGRPKTIRQKDGPNTCVVDLSWTDFRRSWLNADGTSAIFLSHPSAGGMIPPAP